VLTNYNYKNFEFFVKIFFKTAAWPLRLSLGKDRKSGETIEKDQLSGQNNTNVNGYEPDSSKSPEKIIS
jgi:hypothetical protein